MKAQHLEEKMISCSCDRTPPARKFELWQQVGQYKVVGYYFIRTAIAWQEGIPPGWHYVLDHIEDVAAQRLLSEEDTEKLACKVHHAY